jgi:hypothetical protein
MKLYTIIYKSGAKVRFRAKGLVVTHRNSEITEITWDDTNGHLVFGVNEIAAIWPGRK